MEVRRNDDAKYTEGSGNDHLTKYIRKNIELSKYTWYRIFAPHNNVNFKIIVVDGDRARPHKPQKRIRE